MKLILQYFDMVHIREKFNHKQTPTFYHVDKNNTPSTIDYIFGSKNLCNNVTEFRILNNNNWYTSDHKVILTSIDHLNTNLAKNTKFFNLSRDTTNHKDQYNTKDMDSEQWNIFQREINNHKYTTFDDYSNDPAVTDPSIQNFINMRMNQIIQDIKDALTVANTKKNDFLEVNNTLNQNENDYIDLKDIFDAFNKHWKYKRKWLIKLLKLYRLLLNWNMRPFLLDTDIELNRIISLITQLEHAINKQLHLDRSTWDTEQITKFINKRDDNIKNNNKRMLNSILERHPRKITLDRIKYIEDEEIKFSNDKDKITEITNN
ncbi:hypothetical protein RhiirC2_772486 [Rhizophagus irregularis]|uniref:Endonuclease/exonuclease/phosphatase domain-containing protein n=1 Tax=Rhizophagus irregularis TaxID=588596 RepID=A0A2N1NRF1_9GLOM|nr:hypothetical protein RhiirC2_772486 [Rhizophagus irregularis]